MNLQYLRKVNWLRILNITLGAIFFILLGLQFTGKLSTVRNTFGAFMRSIAFFVFFFLPLIESIRKGIKKRYLEAFGAFIFMVFFWVRLLPYLLIGNPDPKVDLKADHTIDQFLKETTLAGLINFIFPVCAAVLGILLWISGRMLFKIREELKLIHNKLEIPNESIQDKPIKQKDTKRISNSKEFIITVLLYCAIIFLLLG